jgi:hypothetical protein
MKGRRGKMRSLSFYNSEGEKRRVFARVYDARHSVSMNLLLDNYLIVTSDRGVPWNCLLSRGCKRHKNQFPHRVLEAFAIGGSIYVQTTSVNRAGQLPTFIRYRHNFTPKLRKFDTFSRARFLDHFGDKGVEVEFLPPRPASTNPQSGEHKKPERRREQRHPTSANTLIARGAYRRALDAGLVFETRPA